MYVEIERRTVYAVSLCVFQFFLPKKIEEKRNFEEEETGKQTTREKRYFFDFEILDFKG